LILKIVSASMPCLLSEHPVLKRVIGYPPENLELL